MADVPASYSYENQVRDITDILVTLITQQPNLLSLVSQLGYSATQHKHEYPELQLTPEQTTLSAAVANDAAVTWSVNSVAPFSVSATRGTICRIDGFDEIVKVTAIDAEAKTITVTRGYGSSTKPGKAIPKDTKIIVVSKPNAEASRAALAGGATPPTLNWNECEIFDEEAVVSNSQGQVYGISRGAQDPVGAMMNIAIAQKLLYIQRRMNSALIHGRRVERSSVNPIGTMGGLLQFHEGGNAVDGKGNAITETMLGDALEKCFAGGAPMVNTLLCNVRQARNISAIYKGKLTIARGDTQVGQVIYNVQPDFPVAGYISKIVVDPTFPENKISLFDIGLIAWLWLNGRRLTDKPSQAPGDDFVARRILGEGTAEFRNWPNATCLIDNLSTQQVK